MANSLSTRVISIDTSMASGYQAILGKPEKLSLRVLGVKLIAGSAAATATVTDPVSGATLIKMSAPASAVDYTQFPVPVSWADFEAAISGTGALLLIFTI